MVSLYLIDLKQSLLLTVQPPVWDIIISQRNLEIPPLVSLQGCGDRCTHLSLAFLHESNTVSEILVLEEHILIPTEPQAHP